VSFFTLACRRDVLVDMFLQHLGGLLIHIFEETVADQKVLDK
jgi:hypothetical protein